MTTLTNEDEGKLLGPVLERQIRDLIRADMAAHLSLAQRHNNQRRHIEPNSYRIILDDTVAAQTDPLAVVTGSIDPLAPNATVCRWSTRRKRYVQTSKRLAVCNTSDTEYPVDNAAWAIYQAGHYELAGCPVEIANRPAPPWQGA